jgi:biopolymer transport protein ExbD
MSVGLGEGAEQDFDLNIAPIIDCFTVLIAYLLLSASFVSVGIFDVGASVASDSPPQSQTPPSESAQVRLLGDRGMELKLSGKEAATFEVPARADGSRDFSRLIERVADAKGRFPELAEASVTADAKVEYREIIQAIEAVRKQLPKVYMGD